MGSACCKANEKEDPKKNQGNKDAQLANFPKDVPRKTATFENWSLELFFKSEHYVEPRSVADVVAVCNWAKDNACLVRAVGAHHGWSTLSIGPDDRERSNTVKVVFIDMTKLNKYKGVVEVRPGVWGATAEAGCSLDDFVTALEGEKNFPGGFGMTHYPTLAPVTLGGMLAVGAHGTAAPIKGQDELPSGYGSLSNRVLKLTAICWDESTKQYALKEFVRGQADEEDRAFICNLGRTIITEVQLRVEPNFYLRCLSVLDVSMAQYAQDWNPEDPATPNPPEKSIQWWFEQSGRLELIWFPHMAADKNFPWLKAYYKTTPEEVPIKFPNSRKTDKPYNYPVVFNIPEVMTPLYKLLIGAEPGNPEVTREIFRKALEGVIGGQALADLLTLFDIVVNTLTAEVFHARCLTPVFAQASQAIVKHAITKGNKEGQVLDLWGLSKNTQLYVTPDTMRETMNGYCISMNRKNLQRGLKWFFETTEELNRQYAHDHLYPINTGLEIRITGLDWGKDTGIPNAKAPYLSPTAADDEDAVKNGWDVQLWVDAVSLPTTKGLWDYFTQLESRIVACPYFQGAEGRMRAEWSKGWSYTSNGAQSSALFNQYLRGVYPNFDKAADVFAKYDRGQIFTNTFLDELFTPYELPQNENPAARATRKQALERERKTYQWEVYDWNGPGYVKNGGDICQEKHWIIPGGVQGLGTIIDTTIMGIIKGLPVTLENLWETLFHTATFENFNKLYGDDQHYQIANWRTDHEFARQQFNGLNPRLIRRAKATDFGPQFNVTNAMMPTGLTIEEAIAQRKLFIVDYALLTDGISEKNHVVTPKIALVLPNGNVDSAQPVAIQLLPPGHSSGKGGLVYTPETDAASGQWLMARLFCQNACVNLQDSIYHNLHNHFISETLYVALRRNLSSRHPLYQVLLPHGWNTIAINEVSRGNLKNSGKGPITVRSLGLDQGYIKTLTAGFREYTWNVHSVEKDLDARDMRDVPGYTFWEDGLELWQTEKKYVNDLIDVFYKSDADVANDYELQNFAAEILDPKMGALGGKSLPFEATGSKFTTRDQLKEVVLNWIWIATAGHAIMNNYQWINFGFIPNMPGQFLFTIPDKTQKINESDMVAKVPYTIDTIILQLNTAALVDVPEKWHPMSDIFLTYPTYMSNFPKAREVVTKNKQDLLVLAGVIDGRNVTRVPPYNNMDPRHIAQSVNL